MDISRMTASPKATCARLVFVTGSGQALVHQDKCHTSESVSDQGERLAVD